MCAMSTACNATPNGSNNARISSSTAAGNGKQHRAGMTIHSHKLPP
jgi:hypothetical protein